VFTARRGDYTEICVLLSGRVTLEVDGQDPVALSAGGYFVTPRGWVGTCTRPYARCTSSSPLALFEACGVRNTQISAAKSPAAAWAAPAGKSNPRLRPHVSDAELVAGVRQAPQTVGFDKVVVFDLQDDQVSIDLDSGFRLKGDDISHP
jgi:EutQ-like cupin domain